MGNPPSESITMHDRIARAQSRIDARELIAFLQEMVRIPSVVDPDLPDASEQAVVDRICAWLGQQGLSVRRTEVAPGRPNLVIDIPGNRAGPILLFEGHTDVVTPGDLRQWTVEPFAAEVRDGRLYGRGACDMKAGLAAMLFAARALTHQPEFAGTIRLAILVDEEGLMRGAREFVAEGWLDDVAAAVICEPEGDRLCIAQKGAMRIAIHLIGKMAHACMPEEGVNPVVALGEVLSACRTLEMQLQVRFASDPLLGKVTLTPTVVSAGHPAQANVIPGSAELRLDIRTTPVVRHDELLDELNELLAETIDHLPGIRYELELIDDRSATLTDRDDPIVSAALDAHEAETGMRPPFGGVPGSTDGTIFWAARQLPVIVYGPGETTMPHQADESVSIADVTRYARTYVSLALRYFERMERD